MTPAKYLSIIVKFNYVDTPFHPLLNKISNMLCAQEDVVVCLRGLIDQRYPDLKEREDMQTKLNLIFLPSYQAAKSVIDIIQENKVDLKIITIADNLMDTITKFNIEYSKLAAEVCNME